MNRRARAARRRAELGGLVVALVGVGLAAVAFFAAHPGAVAPGGFADLLAGGSTSTGSGPQLTGGRVVIPRLRVDAPVDPVRSPNGVLGVPEDPKRVGWWTGSAVPGSGHGGVVVDGHVNYRGTAGALSVVPKLRRGDIVNVQLPDPTRTVGYTVRAVREYSKHPGLPADIFDQAGPERLVLITCGGTFDSSSGNYESNVIAFAYPS